MTHEAIDGMARLELVEERAGALADRIEELASFIEATDTRIDAMKGVIEALVMRVAQAERSVRMKEVTVVHDDTGIQVFANRTDANAAYAGSDADIDTHPITYPDHPFMRGLDGTRAGDLLALIRRPVRAS